MLSLADSVSFLLCLQFHTVFSTLLSVSSSHSPTSSGMSSTAHFLLFVDMGGWKVRNSEFSTVVNES